jgi:hypothetical protein
LTNCNRAFILQVWHDKDLSLLKDPDRRASAYILQPFTGNGDFSIYVKKF